MICFIVPHKVFIYEYYEINNFRCGCLGILKPEPGWWSPKSNDEYNKRAKCVSDHYSTMVVKQLPGKPHINGTFTLGDNIADIGGKWLAYYAYGK